MPRIIYTALFYLLSPLYFIRLMWKGFKNPDYLNRWNERLGLGNSSPSKSGVLWIHAVSVGEVKASLPLLKRLSEGFPEEEILVTTSTPTGSELLINNLGHKVKHQYIPIDLPICINLFLKQWSPKALILVETEIWPNIINLCNKKGIFISLVNARLSEKSKKNYLFVNSLISISLEKIDLILAQYFSDKKRFNEIIKHKEIKICGNLKFDQETPKEIFSISEKIREDWSIGGKKRPTLIAASTHDTEEDIILSAFSSILIEEKDALLIISPRHPERFSKVYRMIQNKDFTVSRRSKKEEVLEKTNVLLGDTMGELIFLYSISDIAFVGGSIIDHGGQNLLEPAALGLSICSGSNLRNFEKIASQLKKEGGLVIVKNSMDISKFFLRTISEKKELTRRGDASKRVFQMNKGAVEKIYSALLPHLDSQLK